MHPSSFLCNEYIYLIKTYISQKQSVTLIIYIFPIYIVDSLLNIIFDYINYFLMYLSILLKNKLFFNKKLNSLLFLFFVGTEVLFFFFLW